MFETETGSLATPAEMAGQHCYSVESRNLTLIPGTPQIWLKRVFSILLLALNVSEFKKSFQAWFTDTFCFS